LKWQGDKIFQMETLFDPANHTSSVYRHFYIIQDNPILPSGRIYKEQDIKTVVCYKITATLVPGICYKS
jgi:hypothetical protein